MIAAGITKGVTCGCCTSAGSTHLLAVMAKLTGQVMHVAVCEACATEFPRLSQPLGETRS